MTAAVICKGSLASTGVDFRHRGHQAGAEARYKEGSSIQVARSSVPGLVWRGIIIGPDHQEEEINNKKNKI
jgi:hypothetical protein